MPGMLLLPDAPNFTIAEVNQAYLKATGKVEPDLIGKGIFNAFADNTLNLIWHNVSSLHESLDTVISTAAAHSIAAQKNNAACTDSNQFNVTYWDIENIPVAGNNGEVCLIIHMLTNVTERFLQHEQRKKAEDQTLIINAGSGNAKDELNKIMDISMDGICTMNDAANLILNDVTEKIKIEESNTFMAELLNTIDQAVMATDLNGVVSFWNKAAEEIYGWSAEEAIGYNIMDLAPIQQTREQAGEILQQVLKGDPWSGECMMQRKNGTTFPVFVTNSPIYDKHQKVKGVIGVFSDITDRRNTEKQITTSDRQFEIIYNTVSDIIFMLSVEDNNRFKYISVNHTFLKATGLQEHQVTGQYVDDVIPPSSLELVLANYNEVIIHKKTVSWEESSEYPTGIKTGLVTLSPVIDEHGKCTMLVGSVHDITERKKAEEEINQSNQRYSYVSKATSDAIWDWDLIDKTIQWGEGFQTLFGYNLNETKNNITSWTDHIHPGDVERVTKGIYELTGGNQSNWHDEYRFQKKDQTYAYIADKGFVIRDKEGKALRMVGSMQDITKRKQDESALQQSEARHRGIISSQTNYVIRTDVYGNYTYYNQKFIDDFGWIHNKNDIIGLNCMLSIMAYHRERVEGAVEKCLNNMNEIFQVEIDKPSKNGDVKTTLWDFICLSDYDGRPSEIQCVGIDISDRKLAEKAYINTLEEKNTILESIGDAFFAVDKDWTVTYWNNQAERMLGMSKTKVLSHNLWEVFAGRTNSDSYLKLHQAIESQEVVHFQDYSKFSSKWYEISAYPSVSGLAVYFRDITERKLSEIRLNSLNEDLQKKAKELAVSNEELEQFAYVASHDLQEPLRTVTSFLTLLEKKYGEVIDEKGKKYIDFAVDGAKRMRQIILDLLEFSKVGKTEDMRQELDLNELIKEIKILCGKQITEKNAVIFASQLPVIHTYKAPLRQFFHNLIGNALKYTKKDIPPHINIVVEKLKEHWQFAVTDNGIGIGEEYLDKIFIIFQRLHNKNDFSGTGIGLAITKKIIENMGGKIWVESTEGKGSSFYFILPRT